MEIEEEYKVPSLIKSYGLRIILPQIYRGKMIPNPNRLKILRQIHECQEELKRISWFYSANQRRHGKHEKLHNWRECNTSVVVLLHFDSPSDIFNNIRLKAVKDAMGSSSSCAFVRHKWVQIQILDNQIYNSSNYQKTNIGYESKE